MLVQRVDILFTSCHNSPIGSLITNLKHGLLYISSSQYNEYNTRKYLRQLKQELL